MRSHDCILANGGWTEVTDPLPGSLRFFACWVPVTDVLGETLQCHRGAQPRTFDWAGNETSVSACPMLQREDWVPYPAQC